jgi:hypothetical protein
MRPFRRGALPVLISASSRAHPDLLDAVTAIGGSLKSAALAYARFPNQRKPPFALWSYLVG